MRDGDLLWRASVWRSCSLKVFAIVNIYLPLKEWRITMKLLCECVHVCVHPWPIFNRFSFFALVGHWFINLQREPFAAGLSNLSTQTWTLPWEGALGEKEKSPSSPGPSDRAPGFIMFHQQKASVGVFGLFFLFFFIIQVLQKKTLPCSGYGGAGRSKNNIIETALFLTQDTLQCTLKRL